MLKYRGKKIIPGVILVLGGTEYPVVPTTGCPDDIGLLWKNNTYNYSRFQILLFLEGTTSKIIGGNIVKHNTKHKILQYE